MALANNFPLQVSSEPNSPGSENDGDLGWISETNDLENYMLVKDLSVGQVSVKLLKIRTLSEFLKLEDKRLSSENYNEYKIREISLSKITED